MLSFISIADLSCLLQASHLKLSSFILKWFRFSFSLQFLHSCIFGGKSNMHNNQNLNIPNTKSKSFSVSDIVYNVFNNSCNML